MTEEKAAPPASRSTQLLRLAGAIAQKTVTYDLARQMEGATEVKCSEFAGAIIDNM